MEDKHKETNTRGTGDLYIQTVLGMKLAILEG